MNSKQFTLVILGFFWSIFLGHSYYSIITVTETGVGLFLMTMFWLFISVVASACYEEIQQLLGDTL